MTVLLLSAHDLRIFDVIAYFLLASPMARVRDTAHVRVVGVEYLLVLVFRTYPVRRRCSSEHRLGSWSEGRGAHDSAGAHRSSWPIVFDSIFNWQQIIKLEELIWESILGRFEDVHGGASNIYLWIVVELTHSMLIRFLILISTISLTKCAETFMLWGNFLWLQKQLLFLCQGRFLGI